MEKKVLSEIALYSGKIKRPKGYEINRSKIKADILEAKLQNKSISDNPFDFRFFDYEARYSKELGYVIENTVEYARLNFQLNLEPVLTFANVLEHKEQSFSRLILDRPEKQEFADFVLVYGVDVYPESTQVVVEYDNNKYLNNAWFAPIENDHYVMFPTSQKFFITRNTSHNPNVFLIITFKKI